MRALIHFAKGLFILVVWCAPIQAQESIQNKENRHDALREAPCFKNLSHLQDEMELFLKFVYVQEFREAIRRSLTTSIPDAVKQMDGFKAEIDSLRREIQHQDRVEKSAEFIAREVSKNPDGPLRPCRRTEKGGYCETLERYYMARAANLANRGFLQALECYQKQGLE